MANKLMKYIGHPYEKKNCFVIAKEFYANEFGIDLTNYYEGNDTPDRRVVETLIASNKGKFRQVDKPVYGDIVVIKLYGIECHIGVCISEEMFLHSTRGVGSCIERLAKYQHMIVGYYRHD